MEAALYTVGKEAWGAGKRQKSTASEKMTQEFKGNKPSFLPLWTISLFPSMQPTATIIANSKKLYQKLISSLVQKSYAINKCMNG